MIVRSDELIPVANTFVGKEEAQAVYDVVASGWLSTGRVVKKFEEKFSQVVDAPYAVSLNSGTAALHVALAALQIGMGDEVILPSLTFVSTANVVLYQGATPVLAECDPKTYNLTVETVQKKITKKTKAIILVDMNGMPADYDSILQFEKKGIRVIADSAESLGAVYKGRKVGSIAKIHCFSFFPNKNITTGEGGMIVTNDQTFAEKCAKIRHQGQEKRYVHVFLGYNYRMTEMQAAIGLVQLEKFPSALREKTELAARYTKLLKEIPSIATPYVPPEIDQHAWYMYAISCKSEKERNRIVKELEQRKIETRLSFPPVHIQPFYREKFGYRKDSLPVTYDAWSHLIDIPLWAGMGQERQDRVIDSLKEIIGS